MVPQAHCPEGAPRAREQVLFTKGKPVKLLPKRATKAAKITSIKPGDISTR